MIGASFVEIAHECGCDWRQSARTITNFDRQAVAAVGSHVCVVA